MTAARQQLGRRAEGLAVQELRRQGFEVLARNVRTPLGEIDVIARDRDALVFVEVKAARLPRAAGPERAELGVCPAKQRRLRRAARAWLAGSSCPARYGELRFDVIAVGFDRAGRLAGCEHLRAAF